jgi:DNA topoisomerase-1
MPRARKKSRELVIVESPAKARTIEAILGNRYQVKASVGHVRDLPKSKLGVDVEHDFAPSYVVPRDKRKVVNELSKAAKEAPAVFLATDPDREGEAISWHLVEAAKLNSRPVHRVVFHEVTQQAVEEAFRNTREIDMKLVNAQQARRVLDRLVGYKISPLLWKKVKRGTSAGRVQSVALKMVVDREREVQDFVPTEYWSIEAELARKEDEAKRTVKASLLARWGEKELPIPNQDEADILTADLEPAEYVVAAIRRRNQRRRPSPPFTTSTLQQEASRKLRFTARRTMAIAQKLYEGLSVGSGGPIGLITYMRTDSTQVASSAQAEARDFIRNKHGSDFVPSKPRTFRRKTKGAQEAHEAIRPTSVLREPGALKDHLSNDQLRLYRLIWQRFLASQMSDAQLELTAVDIRAENTPSGTQYLFRANGSVLLFSGFYVVYREGHDDAEEEDERRLPQLNEGEKLDLQQLTPEQHFTQPPPRFTDASLIRALEENGIGRPSTYAPTIATLEQRGYIIREERRLRPLDLGIVVSDQLTKHFPDIVNVGFTAQMEEELDEIARGEQEWVSTIRRLYNPLEEAVALASVQMEKIKPPDEITEEACDQCGRHMVIKQGRYGRFMACSGFPECRNTKPLMVRIGVACPDCGGDIVEKRSKKGRTFYGCANYPECKFTSWQRPITEPCPECGGLLTRGAKNQVKCTSCSYAAVGQPEGDEAAVSSGKSA